MAERAYTVEDVAREIVAYLPNPGQYEQNIAAAHTGTTGEPVTFGRPEDVVLIMDNDQQFRIWIEAVV